MANYLRGQLAAEAGINVETLRYYEKIKLLPTPQRTSSGYRYYPEETLTRLAFIKQAKDSGFSLEEIKQLFSIIDMDLDSTNFEDIARMIDKKVEELDARMIELNAMKEILVEVKGNLREQCPDVQEFFNRLKNL